MDLIRYIVLHSTELVESGGIFTGFLLVFIECFIPALPLSVFVALNVNAFGFLPGCLLSWIATCSGSYICYKFFYFIESKLTDKFLNRKLVKKIKNGVDKFEKIKFTELVLILTLPFTPSSLVNLLCGITRMSNKKFIGSLLIGKLFSIFFWGFIGKSFIESLTDVKSLIYVGLTLLLAYIISKIVSRRLDIEWEVFLWITLL